MDFDLIQSLQTFQAGTGRPRPKLIEGPLPTLSIAPNISGELVLYNDGGRIAAAFQCDNSACKDMWIDGPKGSRRCECFTRLHQTKRRINALKAPWRLSGAAKHGRGGTGMHEHLSSTVEALQASEDDSSFVTLSGPHGTGKSHAACWASIKTCMCGLGARWVMAEELVAEVISGYQQNKSMGQVLQPYVEAELLVLDEVKALRSEHASEVVSHALRRRYDAMRRTIVTTNLGLGELRKAVDTQMAHRLGQGRFVVASAPQRGAA